MKTQFTRMLLSALLTAIGFVSISSDNPVCAQANELKEYRVGNLIENGYLGDPKGWKLENFGVDPDSNLTRKNEAGAWGTATTPFLGPDGFYKIRVHYFDEADGVSTVKLSVGDRAVGSWQFDGILVESWKWKEFDGVKINHGDEIVLAGRGGGYEYCRIGGVEILPSQPIAAAAAGEEVPTPEYSLNLVPLERGAREPKYLVAPGAAFTGGNGVYWVYVEKGKPFRLNARASYAGRTSSLQYSLTKIGGDKPLVSETLLGENAEPIRILHRGLEEGLYELNVSAAAEADHKDVLIDVNVPAVRGPGYSEGYFFVPKGVKKVGVTTSGHTVIMDAANKVLLDEWFDNAVAHVIAVPAGSDNQVWYFQGEVTRLAGVPPYVAVKREATLVPAELLKDR